jgi:hypothetical protein
MDVLVKSVFSKVVYNIVYTGQDSGSFEGICINGWDFVAGRYLS